MAARVTVDPDAWTARFVLRRINNRMAELFSLARREADERAREEFTRAYGACVCGACDELYCRHARDPFEPWLTMLCDGRRVKL